MYNRCSCRYTAYVDTSCVGGAVQFGRALRWIQTVHESRWYSEQSSKRNCYFAPWCHWCHWSLILLILWHTGPRKKTVKLKERTIPKTWCTWCLFPVWGVTIFTKELQYLADLAVGSVSTGKYEYQRWIQGNSMMQCLGNVLGPFGLGVARTLKVPLHPPMLLTCWVLKMHSVCFFCSQSPLQTNDSIAV